MLQWKGFKCLQKAPRRRWVLALLPAVLALNSCGGGSGSTAPPAPTLTISCDTTSLVVNGSTACHENLNGLSSTLVNWEAGGIQGGNSTFGTIDTNGKYIAPATVPTNNIVTITAIAVAQSTLTATATITILPATAISQVICLDPGTKASSLTVASGKSLACMATDAGGNPISVFWEVDTITGGNGSIGKISAQGNYVAPLIPPAGGTVTITAISQAVSTQTLSVTITDTFGNAALQGSYAFSTSGRQTATNGFFARVGSFVADGNGRLTGGLEDVNPQPSGISPGPIPFSGTYSVGADGRGTMQFCEPSNSSACTSPTTQFRFVVISPQLLQVIDFQGGSVANGEIVLQPDISVFNTASLVGPFTFGFSGFSGFSSATTEESAVGEFAADGLPDHTTGLAKITSGELDINNGGALISKVTILRGTYSVNSNGRGTATIVTSGPTLKLAFYMISAGRAKFLETDSSPILTGDSAKQQSLVPWGPSALDGNVVLGTEGSGPSSGIADLISFTAAAISGTSNGTITAASIDENSGGTVASSSSLTGTYSFDVSGNGRGTLSIPGHSYVFYMIAPAPTSSAVVQEITAGLVAHGSMLEPLGGPFTGTALKGSYAFDMSGKLPTGEEDVVGQLTADGDPNNTGTGKITVGTLDVNNFGTLQSAQPNMGTYSSTVAASGRTTMSLTPTGGTAHGYVIYFLSPTTNLALGTDGSGPTTAEITRQF